MTCTRDTRRWGGDGVDCPTFFRGYLAHLWCEKCQTREDVHVAAREMRMLDGGKLP
jgi:hypothetical protein